MSYHGYIPSLKQLIKNLSEENLNRHINVLEIGTDRGVTFISLAAQLERYAKGRSLIVGIDIAIQESFQYTLMGVIDNLNDVSIALLKGNSLNELPKLVNEGITFDIILIDGDHNYYTVSQELQYIKSLVKPHTVIVIDDYHGRWSERDLWYSLREGYENVSDATKPIETQFHGVKAAVDEFISNNPEWSINAFIEGEPVVLTLTSSD